MFRFFLIILTSGLVSATLSAEIASVPLRLSADEGAAVIAEISAEHPTILSSAPVTDPTLSSSDWHWSEYAMPVTGYIETKFLTKNFSVMIDTFVYAKPQKAATVLTIIKPDDLLKIVSTNDEWTAIRFNKALLVYFKQPTIHKVAADIDVSPASGITIQPAEPIISIPPVKKSAAPVLAAPKPPAATAPKAPVATMTRVQAAPPIMSTPESSETEVQKSSPAASVTQIQAPAAPKPVVEKPKPLPLKSIILGSPTATLDNEDRELEASRQILRISGVLASETLPGGGHFLKLLSLDSGELITYIDASRLPIQNYTPFVDRKVHLFGELRQFVPERDDLLILAYTMRLAE